MDEDTLQKLKEIKKIKAFMEYIAPFYPNLDTKEFTIAEIELALYSTYIKLIGKIMGYSPVNMRRFLRSYLLKFEIINIKQIILDTIIGKSREEKIKNINFLIEEYLENTEFIQDLLEIPSLDEIQLYLRPTKYNQSVREGLLYFRNNNEAFVLEAFLDQLYYKNLIKVGKGFSRKERAIINLYIKIVSEIYNLNMIYRGIKNKIDKKLLAQFLVDYHLFLDKEKIESLLSQESVDNFFSIFEEYLSNIKDIKDFYRMLGINRENLIWSLQRLYVDYYFKKYQIKVDDIEYSTILRILEVLILKENEINFEIIPKVVKILHEKFEILK